MKPRMSTRLKWPDGPLGGLLAIVATWGALAAVAVCVLTWLSRNGGAR
jgi:hypothetical protein